MKAYTSDPDFVSSLHFKEGRFAYVGSFLAVLFSLALHFVILACLPDQLLLRLSKGEAVLNPPLMLELEELQPNEMRFVEANPEAPENVPDKSRNYSYRNQQAAELNPSLIESSDKPFVDGVEQSQKIIEGQFPQEAMVTVNQQLNLNQNTATENTVSTAVPLKGIDRPEFLMPKIAAELTDSGSGILGSEDQIAVGSLDGNLQLYEPKEGREVAETTPNTSTNNAKLRPRLDPKLLPGPLMQSASAASRRGQIAIDSTFSEFGEYQQQFFAPVLGGWYQEIEFYQPIDVSARVLVRLTLHSDGRVSSVKTLETSATEIATMICESAIAKRSPFRPWTKEMVEVFGKERTLTVLFIYQ